MIKVFYGPKVEFEKILPTSEGSTTLVELARKSDSRRREHYHRFDGVSKEYTDERERIETLVAYSDEYAGINEHAIQSFISFIESFDVQDMYLQNPPEYIVQQLKKSGRTFDSTHHQYGRIDPTKLAVISENYDRRIIGQDSVKKRLLATLYPWARGHFEKPCVILFYGPTGVGKTETAKFLSEILNENLFRKQFSMFHNETFADYLFGGAHSQNSFAKELLERESNIILLDEFDKPHPVFFSAFYQLFDEGVFEDKNYEVKIKQAIFICTSNFLSEEDICQKLGEPIFSRFDAVIKFDPLPADGIKQIIELEFNKLALLLDDIERDIVNKSGLLEKAIANAGRLKNARQVKKVIREAVYGLISQTRLSLPE